MKIQIVLLLIIILLTGCSEVDIKKDNVLDSSCEAKAEKLVPDRVSLWYWEHNGEPWSMSSGFKWLDGTNSQDALLIDYKLGSKTGESVNYYYPYVPPILDEHVGYSKQVVNGEGIILGTNNFKVDLILKPIPNTQTKMEEHAQSYKVFQDFEVVEVKFISCNFIE